MAVAEKEQEQRVNQMNMSFFSKYFSLIPYSTNNHFGW